MSYEQTEPEHRMRATLIATGEFNRTSFMKVVFSEEKEAAEDKQLAQVSKPNNAAVKASIGQRS